MSVASFATLATLLQLAVTVRGSSAIPPPKPLYLAFGGSNTCGHYTPRPRIYYNLVTNALRERGLVSNGVNLCIPAMGPQYSAACLDSLVPVGSTFATVEYLPNMLAGDLDVERSAYDTLVRGLVARGVRVAIVELVPSKAELSLAQWRAQKRFGLRGEAPVNATATVAEIAAYDAVVARVHSGTLELAAQLDIPVVTLNMNDARSRLFGDFHLNLAGHAAVTSAVLPLFANSSTAVVAGAGASTPAGAPRGNEPSAGSVSCAIGKALARQVLSATGFAQVDLSGGGNSSTHTPKVAWESRGPDARLVLCARSLERFGAGTILIGFQKSHERNLPTVGIADISCVGCNCTLRAPAPADDCDATDGRPPGARRCTYDLLHRQPTTETVFVELAARIDRPVVAEPRAACGCQVHITVAPHPTRRRVIVRASIVADSATAGFVRTAVIRYAHLKQSDGRRRSI